MRHIFGTLSARYPKLVQSFTALALVLSLPLLVFAALTVQNLVQKASNSNTVKILNENNSPITETTETVVKLQITLPSDWVLPGGSPTTPDQQDGAFLSVPKVYAQSNGSTCLSVSIKGGTTVAIGQSYEAEVRIQNNGGDWVWDGSNPYRLGSIDPLDNTIWSIGRVDLPVSPIKSGDIATFKFNIWPPEAPGKHSFNWQMVQEGIGWFGSGCYLDVIVIGQPTATPQQTSIPTQVPTQPTILQQYPTQPPDQPTQFQQLRQTKHTLKSITIENQGDLSSKKTFSTPTEIINLLSAPKQWELKSLEENEQQATRTIIVTLSDGNRSTFFTTSIILKKQEGLKPQPRIIDFDSEFLDIPNRKSLEDRYLQKLEEIPPDLYDKSLFRPLSAKVPSETENCLTVGFWVETTFEDFFNPNNNQLFGHESDNTFEEWAKTQIDAWNYIFEESGIRECVRLEKIVRVYDNSLPLNGGLSTNHPDKKDRSVDIIWGFPASGIANKKGVRHWNRVLNGVDWALLHELSHARYIVDEYTVDVGEKNSKIEVRDPQGDLIVGKYFKIEEGILYYNKSQDLMGGSGLEPIYAPHQAGAFNRILHQQTRQEFGNFNHPSNIGIYLDDIPEDNILIILDENKKPIENARIKIFQSTPPAPGGEKIRYGEKFIDNIPDLEGNTDYLGRIHVGSNPFGNTTRSLGLGAPWNKKIYPSGNNSVFILEVFYNDHVFYKFIEVSDFNLAYWAGHTQEAEYEIQTEYWYRLDKIPPLKQVGISDEQYEAFKACFKKDLSSMPSCRLYDFDKDGDVDEQDYKLFLQSLGK